MPIRNLLCPAPRSALILGAGYLGLRVGRRWAASGIRTTAVTRREDRAREIQSCGLDVIIGDFGRTGFLRPLPPADVVMWSVGLDAASRSSRRQVWIDGLQRVLDALPLSDHPSRLLYCSSTSVYGESLEGVDEDTPPSPRGEGGEVCLRAEELTREFGVRTGCAVTVLRLAGLYGPDRLLRRLDDLRNRVPIEADPQHWLNLIHVDDAAAIVEAVSRLPAPPPLINVVSPRPVTRGEYYRTLAELAGTPEPLFQPPTGTDATSKRGSANRRIVSRVLPAMQVPTRFDAVRAGLAQAMKED